MTIGNGDTPEDYLDSDQQTRWAHQLHHYVRLLQPAAAYPSAVALRNFCGSSVLFWNVTVPLSFC